MNMPTIDRAVLNPGMTDVEGSGWNAWPSLPVVKVDEVDPFNPHAAYTFGKLMGEATGYRQVRSREIPAEVPLRSAYPRAAGPRAEFPSSALTQVRFAWAGAKGQEDSLRGRHILALIDFPTRWEQGIGYRLIHPAVIVTLGCDHDYETVTKRNCYIKQRCTKCGHVYAVDSGD